MYVKVDAEDFEKFSEYKWVASNCIKRCYTAYALRTECMGKNRRRSVMMHREIMGDIPEGLFVDHINGGGLDNRKKNLRIVTVQQNNWNRKIRKTGASKYTGVTWDKRRGKWRANIYIGNGCKSLGSYEDEKEAARAYDRAAVELRGEYARLNLS